MELLLLLLLLKNDSLYTAVCTKSTSRAQRIARKHMLTVHAA